MPVDREGGMKRLAILFARLSVCKAQAPGAHPHGAPPGQVRKALSRRGSRDAAVTCHGRVMIVD
jgi:hypothetical protein